MIKINIKKFLKLILISTAGYLLYWLFIHLHLVEKKYKATAVEKYTVGDRSGTPYRYILWKYEDGRIEQKSYSSCCGDLEAFVSIKLGCTYVFTEREFELKK